MSLHIDSVYQQNILPKDCAICGRTTGSRRPVRFILMDDDNQLGDVCERCAYGSTDLWRVAMLEYAIRMETHAAVLRSMAASLDDAQPAPEGIAEELIQANMNNRSGFPGRRFGS
ncbi:MAG: hypothetical protein GYB64_06350 [Chloroflexi bacterium]|nr:hypothetical protein [Chloroflexota bacterium]